MGPGRWIILAAGFCGLAVMTMAVTYLLEVQGSVSQRDIGIIKLNTQRGRAAFSADPAPALRRASATGASFASLLREARDWCATVRQSHSNHPSLIYFQSSGTGSGWPAALGAMLDLALLSELCLDDGIASRPRASCFARKPPAWRATWRS